MQEVQATAQSAALLICKLEICLAQCLSWESSSTWKFSWHYRVASSACSRRAKRVLWCRVFVVACPTMQATTLPIQFIHEYIREIWVMILLNPLQQIYVPYVTTEFNTINSEYWILLDFHNEFIILLWIHVNEIWIMSSDFDTINTYIWIHKLINSYESLH